MFWTISGLIIDRADAASVALKPVKFIIRQIHFFFMLTSSHTFIFTIWALTNLTWFKLVIEWVDIYVDDGNLGGQRVK